MKEKQHFALLSFFVVLIGNGLLLAALWSLADGAGALPDAATFFGLGALISLGLWFALQFVAGRFLRLSPSRTGDTPSVPIPPPAEPERPTMPTLPSPAPALQLLALLQRKGRLIDFLNEDLSRYPDDQIGAAVRPIHDGCKQALNEYMKVEPIFTEAEGSQVTIQPGFDAHEVRLVGNITGDPPFKGALRHQGWRVAKVDLPVRVQQEKPDMVLAPAEVEVDG